MPNKEQHKISIKEDIRKQVRRGLTEKESHLYREGVQDTMIPDLKAAQKSVHGEASIYRSKNAKKLADYQRLSAELKELKYNAEKEKYHYNSVDDVELALGDQSYFPDWERKKRYGNCYLAKLNVEEREERAAAVDKVECLTDKKITENYKEVADKYEKLSGWSKWWAKRLPASWYSKADLYAEKCAYEEVLTEYGYKPEEVRKDDYVFEPAVKPYTPDDGKTKDQPEKESIVVNEAKTKETEIEKTEMIGDVAPVEENVKTN